MKYMSTQSGGKGGVVVNVCSFAGQQICIKILMLILFQYYQVLYSASKHRLVGFTCSMEVNIVLYERAY